MSSQVFWLTKKHIKLLYSVHPGTRTDEPSSQTGSARLVVVVEDGCPWRELFSMSEANCFTFWSIEINRIGSKYFHFEYFHSFLWNSNISNIPVVSLCFDGLLFHVWTWLLFMQCIQKLQTFPPNVFLELLPSSLTFDYRFYFQISIWS